MLPSLLAQLAAFLKKIFELHNKHVCIILASLLADFTDNLSTVFRLVVSLLLNHNAVLCNFKLSSTLKQGIANKG